MRFKSRILVPLTLALVLLFAAFLGSSFWTEQEEFEDKFERDLHTVRSLFDTTVQHEAEEMALALRFVAADKEIRAALAARDRQKLLELGVPLLKQLHDEYKITHCYFTRADRVNIVRAHLPAQFGDTINRYTTLQAEKTGQITSGIEIGVTGVFTLRTVMPCYENQKLIGFLELGMEIDHLAREISRLVEVDLCFLADKQLVNRREWEAGMRRLQRDANWDQLSSFVLMDCTTEKEKEADEEPLEQILDQARRDPEARGFLMQWGGRDHQLVLLPLEGANGLPLGKMVVFRDITAIMQAHERAELATIAVCLVVGILLFTLFYVILTRIERRLNAAYRHAMDESRLRELAQQRHMTELRSVGDYLQNVINGIADPIMVVDRQRKIVLENEALRRFVGGTAIGLECGCVLRGTADSEAQNDDCPFDRVFGANGPIKLTQELLSIEGRKTVYEVLASPMLDDSGQVKHIIAAYRDITERQQAEEQLRHGAFHDSLTGLANRSLFLDRLGRCIEHAKRRNNYHFAVLFLDLDRFKIINDGLGHLAGDQFLVAIARRLETCLRRGDTVTRHGMDHTVARVGGDEFIILLDGIKDPSSAIRVAERIQKELEAPIAINGHEFCSTVSIGIALNDADTANPQDLLRDADTALYRAKSLGRARYEVFDNAMHEQAIARLRLENDLRKAVDQNQFQVFYQPIICLQTAQTKGFEALVRWNHPQRGLVAPAEFIPLAEETGLIVPLGWLVMREACLQTRRWQQQFPSQPPLSISVNLSSRQIARPDFLEQIDQILRQTELDAGSLELEITESTLMEDTENTLAALTQLKARGIRLHMDDFGTGYSSLSYLHRFPFDVVKIDRGFVAGMLTSREHNAIVQTILSLAQNLGMKVTAEGIETADQLAKLRQMGCHFAQGFYFSRPVPADAAVAFISRPVQTAAA